MTASRTAGSSRATMTRWTAAAHRKTRSRAITRSSIQSIVSSYEVSASGMPRTAIVVGEAWRADAPTAGSDDCDGMESGVGTAAGSGSARVNVAAGKGFRPLPLDPSLAREPLAFPVATP